MVDKMWLKDPRINWLKDPRVKWSLWGIGGLVLIYLAVGSWLDKIQISEKKLNNAWVTVKENCGQRTQMLPRFGQWLQPQMPQAQQVMAQLSHAYQIASHEQPSAVISFDPATIQKFVAAQNAVVASLLQMEAYVKSVPGLAENRQYWMLMEELQNSERRIHFSAGALQNETIIYNYYITGSLHGWANQAFLHKKTAISFDIPITEATVPKKPLGAPSSPKKVN